MENYIIKKIGLHNFEYLVFGTSVESPLLNIQEIADYIKETKDVKVLFDQLLQTGNSENRFLLINFKNGVFDFNSASCISSKDISASIKKKICVFLKQNPKILEYSILLNEQKKIIEEGGTI